MQTSDSLRAELVRAWILAGYLPRAMSERLRSSLRALGWALRLLESSGELDETFEQ